MEKDYLVTKSNYFIMNSSYDLSLEEQKIILTLASMVQPSDEEFKPYKFKIAEFMKLVGVDDKSKYTKIPKMTKELMKKVFEIEEGKKTIQVAWLSSAVYEKGTGYVELEFSPRLKPYMLKLGTLFTQYKLANILSMKSKYSPRIYEILKCHEFKQQRYIDIEVEELRKLLKTDNMYSQYQDFKRKVILQAQKELNEKTDISFDFEEVKTGRKVTSLKFYIKPNKKVIAPKENSANDEVVATLERPIETIEKHIALINNFTDNEFTEKTIMLFLELSNGDISKIKRLYNYMDTKNIKENRVGYMRTLLENWEEPKASSSKTGFNNFEPRNYDYDSLEKKLLGWE